MHIVLAADTADESIGPSCDVDLANMRLLLIGGLPYQTVERAVELTGPNPGGPPAGQVLSRNSFLAAVRDAIAAAGPDDAVLVYYSGHGVEWRGRGHVLNVPGGDVTREQVRSLLAAGPQRLSVLLTDSCSTAVPPPEVETAAAPAARTDAAPAMVSLLYRARGFVDMSGSAPGEFAMGDGTIGGYFTAALTSYLRENLETPLTWAGVEAAVR
ncbi:caspase family protein, partial [Alienimonas sp. DA493]|uniref:caspase family protein n=1 Tax=Alienimonas sp. DA493 TaxID=3373605 RepID=UPI0037548422